MATRDEHESAQTARSAAAHWPMRLRDWFGGATIQGRLIRNFALAILVPAVVTAIVGVGMIRHYVYAQAQTQVNADLEPPRRSTRPPSAASRTPSGSTRRAW